MLGRWARTAAGVADVADAAGVAMTGHVVSVNVGTPRVTEWHGRAVESGIWKQPVAGRVGVRGVNLDGDAQADLRVHGGPDKAVYAYAAEDYRWWSARLGRELGPASFGENLTVEGLDLGAMVIGTRWLVAGVVLEVSEPRLPCFKLGMRMGDAAFVDEFEQAERFGAYLRIVHPGDVGAGDEIRVEPLGRPGITVHELGAAGHDPPDDLLARVLGDAAVPGSWHAWANRRVARRDDERSGGDA
jgi:MOSC domain-containing protein YiiM